MQRLFGPVTPCRAHFLRHLYIELSARSKDIIMSFFQYSSFPAVPAPAPKLLRNLDFVYRVCPSVALLVALSIIILIIVMVTYRYNRKLAGWFNAFASIPQYTFDAWAFLVELIVCLFLSYHLVTDSFNVRYA